MRGHLRVVVAALAGWHVCRERLDLQVVPCQVLVLEARKRIAHREPLVWLVEAAEWVPDRHVGLSKLQLARGEFAGKRRTAVVALVGLKR